MPNKGNEDLINLINIYDKVSFFLGVSNIKGVSKILLGNF